MGRRTPINQKNEQEVMAVDAEPRTVTPPPSVPHQRQGLAKMITTGKLLSEELIPMDHLDAGPYT